MTLTVLLISIGLVALSAFFVAAEFSLVAARSYRLEEAATRSRAGRAALRSARELSLLLAGAQLGITLCTLGLGAIAKPAVDSTLRPLLEGWGMAGSAAAILSFALALLTVTFVHLVVGEMAPKSWAISHPERSAVLLALPMRGFIILTRPLLLAMNGIANWCLRRFGVEPVDEVAGGRTADDLRQLVDFSATSGALEQGRRDRLVAALDIERTPIRDLARPADGVPIDADVAAIRAAAHATGHLRLVLRDDAEIVGYVHTRDTLHRQAADPASDLLRPLLRLQADTRIHQAVTAMRQNRSHLALVEEDGQTLGILTLTDLLRQLLPTAAVGATDQASTGLSQSETGRRFS